MAIFQLHSAKGSLWEFCNFYGAMKLVRFNCKGVPKGICSKFVLSTEGGGAEPVVMAELQQTPTGTTKEKVSKR